MSNPTKPMLVIDGAQGKIAVLERRADYLKRKLENGTYASSAAADFDRAEVSALRGGIKALKYVSSGGQIVDDEQVN